MIAHLKKTPKKSEFRFIIGHVRRVWGLVSAKHRIILISAAALMAISSGATTATALLLGALVDQLRTSSGSGQSAEIWWQIGPLLGGLALIYIFRESFHLLRRSLVNDVCTQINRDMQLKLVGHVMKVDLETLGSEKSGALHGRIFRCAEGLVHFIRLMFLDFFPAFLTGTFALIAAITKQPIVGVVMLGVAPSAIYLTIRQIKTQKGVRIQLMRDCETIDGMVVEQFNGVEYIRVANTYTQELDRLGTTMETRRKREVKHHFHMSLYGFAKSLNEAFFHIVVLVLAAYLAVTGKITIGDVFTISLLYFNAMSPLNEIHRVIDEGHEASLRVNDLADLLSEPQDISFLKTAQKHIDVVIGEPIIRVEDLTVSYRTSEGRYRRVLDGLNLTIRHGETIGIAGRSGAGKSTWIKVLSRLLHAEQGDIFIGDQPIENLDRMTIAQMIGYVGQNPFVFSGTIAENIAYGNGNPTREEIREAAIMANLDDEIMDMINGYDTLISERGQNLSGGQRQRLALARILLKQAPITILDEATSALDNISERHIQRSLGLKNSDRTTIIIAHRLTTLKDCDRIIVFDEGKIVETGSYEELLKFGGQFYELVHSAENGILPVAA